MDIVSDDVVSGILLFYITVGSSVRDIVLLAVGSVIDSVRSLSLLDEITTVNCESTVTIAVQSQ